jgi:hypothetical protein
MQDESLFEKCNKLEESESAKCALSVFTIATAVVNGRCDAFEEVSTEHGWPESAMALSIFAKTQRSLSFFLQSCSTIKWNKNVRSALDLIWAYEVSRVDAQSKSDARRNVDKCVACGAEESQCHAMVHLFGVPLGARGFEASEWMITDNVLRAHNIDLFGHFKQQWNGLKCGIEDIGKYDESTSYLGIVLPGKQCFDWLCLALDVQSVIPNAFLSIHNRPITMNDVLVLQRRMKSFERGVVDGHGCFSNSLLMKDVLNLSGNSFARQKNLDCESPVNPRSGRFVSLAAKQFEMATNMELEWPCESEDEEEEEGNPDRGGEQEDEEEDEEEEPEEEEEEVAFNPKRQKRRRAVFVEEDDEDQDHNEDHEVAGMNDGVDEENVSDCDRPVGSPFYEREVHPSPIRVPPPPPMQTLGDLFLSSNSADDATLARIRSRRDPSLPDGMRLPSRVMAIRLNADFIAQLMEQGTADQIRTITTAVAAISEWEECGRLPIGLQQDSSRTQNLIKFFIRNMMHSGRFDQAKKLAALGVTYLEAVCVAKRAM